MNIKLIRKQCVIFLGSPCRQVSTPACDEYITFNYADERPALRTDIGHLTKHHSSNMLHAGRGNPQTN